MALEIEKMTNIQERLVGDEAREVGEIIETLSNDFSCMMKNSRMYVLTGEKKKVDLSNSVIALQKMRNFGERFGYVFPDIENDEQAATYLLKFGKEIVFSGR